MNEELNENEQEIVDLDECSKTKPVLIGALVTCALSLFPIIPLLHLIVGSLIAVGMFTKQHGVTIRKRVGAKIGLMSVALGTVFFFPMSSGVWIIVDMTDPEVAQEMKEEQVKLLYEQGNVGMAEFFENNFPDHIEPGQLVFILVLMFLFLVILSSLFGAVFGAIGAAFFKKGPMAL